MKNQTLTSDTVTFGDVVGKFETIDNLALFPRLDTFKALSGLGEAEELLEILSNIVLGGKSILTHGTIEDRDYLLFYSDDGVFDSKRVFGEKLEELSFFSYVGLKLVAFFGREIELVAKNANAIKAHHKRDIKSTFSATVAVVFEANKARSLNFVAQTMFNAFPTLTTIILLDDGLCLVEKKKGSMVLC